VAGGAGSAVNELLLAGETQVQVQNIGLPDRDIEHGSREDCLAMAELDANGLLKQVTARIKTLEAAGLLDKQSLDTPLVRSSRIGD
jgi:1-deoxy-D-xylulose-5-phosphate synthase